MNWFIYGLFATTIFGIQSFLYKTSILEKCSKQIVTFVFMTTAALLSGTWLIFRAPALHSIMLTISIGFLLAALFFTRTMSLMKALDYLPTSKVFPLESSNIVIIVISGIFLYKESFSLINAAGIVAILASVCLIHRDSKCRRDYNKTKKGFIIVAIAILVGSLQEVTNKYMSSRAVPELLVISVYACASIIALISLIAMKNNAGKRTHTGLSIKIGITIGVLNVVGYSFLLAAYSSGPLSLISPLIAVATIVTVLLSRLFLKEELTKAQFGLVMLSVIGVILLRI